MFQVGFILYSILFIMFPDVYGDLFCFCDVLFSKCFFTCVYGVFLGELVRVELCL